MVLEAASVPPKGVKYHGTRYLQFGLRQVHDYQVPGTFEVCTKNNRIQLRALPPADEIAAPVATASFTLPGIAMSGLTPCTELHALVYILFAQKHKRYNYGNYEGVSAI